MIFNPGQLRFTHVAQKDVYVPNLDRDLHCFAVWEDGLCVYDRIAEHMDAHFKVLCSMEVQWSEPCLVQNARRLYQHYIPYTGNRAFHGMHHEKIGSGRFRFIILEDPDPQYRYEQTTSGFVELTNTNILQAKNLYRSWVPLAFRVHSSGNPREFYMHAALILGLDRLAAILDGSYSPDGVLYKDLEGAAGWKSLDDLFRVLNVSVEYLLLRNYEELPQVPSDMDLDVLCRNYQSFASVANVRQYVEQGQPYRGLLNVRDQDISVDMRYVSDGYYDSSWQCHMLSNRILHKNFVYVCKEDDYFFSLLYHALVQKSSVKPEYVERLTYLAGRIGLRLWQPERLNTPDSAGLLLAGFMKGHDYVFCKPIDPGVYENKAVSQLLPQGNVLRHSILRARVKRILKFVLPAPIRARLNVIRYKWLR